MLSLAAIEIVIAGLAIGVLLGLTGGGGSILTVPLLVYVVGLDAKVAIVTSMLIVGVTSLAALLSHSRAGRVAWTRQDQNWKVRPENAEIRAAFEALK